MLNEIISVKIARNRLKLSEILRGFNENERSMSV